MLRRGIISLVVVVCTASSASAQAFDDALAQWQAFFEQLQSAVRVDTSQVAADAEREAAATLKSLEGATNAIIAHDVRLSSLAKAQAYVQGRDQGMRACLTADGFATAKNSEAPQTTVREALGEAEREWLVSGGEMLEFVTEGLARRREFYCSSGEQAAGYCDPGAGETFGASYVAGDSDASIWMGNRVYGTEEVMVAMDFMDVAAPMPTVPFSDDINTAGEAALATRARMKGARMSLARNVLAGIILNGMAGDGL